MGSLDGMVGDYIGIVVVVGGMGVGNNGCGDGLLSGSCVEGYGLKRYGHWVFLILVDYLASVS